MTSTFHNGFFAADADALLSNSNTYFARSTTLNRNVAALANYSATEATSADFLLSQALYSTTSDWREKYEAFLHRIAPEFALDYGCLLSVKFEESQRRGPSAIIFK